MYSNRDLTVTIVPTEGANKGKKIVVRTRTGGEFDPAQAVTALANSAGGVAFLAVGSAKPTLKVSCSSGEEAMRVFDHVGKDTACTISAVFANPSKPTVTETYEGCKISKGGGWKADDGSGVSGDLEFMMVRAWRRFGSGPKKLVAGSLQ